MAGLLGKGPCIFQRISVRCGESITSRGISGGKKVLTLRFHGRVWPWFLDGLLIPG